MVDYVANAQCCKQDLSLKDNLKDEDSSEDKDNLEKAEA